MTAAQRKRLADECRRLAYECVDGTAPEFGRSVLFTDGRRDKPCCTFGHLAVRSDIKWPYKPRDEDMRIVAEANDTTLTNAERHAALAFPLLALADALEGVAQ